MKIPSFFRDYAANYTEGDYVEFDIKGPSGEEFFEIYYYGDIYPVNGTDYIVATDFAPARIVARADSGDIILFDGTHFGYDGMFCDEYSDEQFEKRPLKKLEMAPVKVHIRLGYSIDYEDEKEEYDVDEDDMTELIDGRLIPWDQVITDGFDYINISVTTADGVTKEIGDAELA